MTQDEIIEMARQTGLAIGVALDGSKSVGKHEDKSFAVGRLPLEDFIAFTKLVAEREREAWSKVCEDIRKVFNEKADLAYIAGQKEEREACAKVCDELSDKHTWEGCYADECAHAIRARGDV